MKRPKKERKQMQVGVTVESAGSSSMAALHVPVSANSSHAKISLNIGVVTRDMPDDEDDQLNLTQRLPTIIPGRHGQLRRLLQGVHPQIRARVIARLRALLVERLRRSLLQGTQLVDILYSDILGDPLEPCEEDQDNDTIEHMAEFIFNNLNLAEEQDDVAEDNAELLRLVQQLQHGL